jgi:predicted lipid-binding transport protein (Tim44 family)
MNNLLNIIIAVLIIGWLVGFIGFGAAVGNLIHILIVLAIIGIVYRLRERPHRRRAGRPCRNGAAAQ